MMQKTSVFMLSKASPARITFRRGDAHIWKNVLHFPRLLRHQTRFSASVLCPSAGTSPRRVLSSRTASFIDLSSSNFALATIFCFPISDVSDRTVALFLACLFVHFLSSADGFCLENLPRFMLFAGRFWDVISVFLGAVFCWAFLAWLLGSDIGFLGSRESEGGRQDKALRMSRIKGCLHIVF